MADNTKKTRGRPKKEFISRKPKIKKDGPGRPRKIIKEEKKPEVIHFVKTVEKQDDTKKDRFILWMFVFSLIIFTVSLYFAQKKQALEIANDTWMNTEISINTGDLNTWAVDITWTNITGSLIESGTIANTMTNIDTTEPAESTIIKNFYDAFKNGTISTLSWNIDQSLRSSKLFTVFFSKKWSQRFLSNLNSEGLQLGTITSDWNPNPTLTYKISYTLQNGQAFEETRQTSIVNTPTQKITKMMCINTWCSKLPFFNPGKYH